MSTTVQPVRADAPRRRGVLAGLRGLARDTVRGMRGHDLPLHAAGATFYAGIAIVPSALVAIWVLSLLLGDAQMKEYADQLAASLPDQLGAPSVASALVQAAAGMTALTALIAFVPATFYGEGLRRAFGVVLDQRETLIGWRGRLRVLPLLAAAPVLALLVLAITPKLGELLGSGEARQAALGVYLAFLVDWVALSVALVYVYRYIAPAQLGWRAALWGGFGMGSVLSGFVQGFVLFLALPLDIGRPFGGFRPVGGMVAIGLWLWLLHLLVLVGFEVTRHIDERGGVPWAPRAPARAGARRGRVG